LSSTTFTDYTTPIVASWLNDVNNVAYTIVPAINISLAGKAASGANTDITSITGNAATATTAAACSGNAATATNASQLGGVAAASYAVRSQVVTFDDITTLRAGTPTTGVVWFGNTGLRYIYWDGSIFQFTGPITSSGNITAYSDERVKTNWRDLGYNFVQRLSYVKSGVYDRTDEEMTQVGVSAQSLQKVMPEAVVTSVDGKLSVAYGNAALAACIELAKEVVMLRERLAVLEAK
jgi:hypothetical protein